MSDCACSRNFYSKFSLMSPELIKFQDCCGISRTKEQKLLRENARSIPQKVEELWKVAEGSIRSVGTQERALADTFETTKQRAKLAAQDNTQNCVVQACNDIATRCKATAPLKTAFSRNDLPQRLGRQSVKAKQNAPTVCSIGTDEYMCPNCGKSNSWRHLGIQKTLSAHT